MTNSDTLDKIQEAEKQAELILETGLKEKQKILNEGEKQAFNLLSEAKEKEEKIKQDKINDFKTNFEKERKSLETQNQAEIDKLKQSANKKINKEADFLFKKFLEEA